MSKFGWSYPPGVTQAMIDAQVATGACEVCRGDPEGEPGQLGSCSCPECPVCGVTGDPECYKNGHIVEEKLVLAQDYHSLDKAIDEVLKSLNAICDVNVLIKDSERLRTVSDITTSVERSLRNVRRYMMSELDSLSDRLNELVGWKPLCGLCVESCRCECDTCDKLASTACFVLGHHTELPDTEEDEDAE